MESFYFASEEYFPLNFSREGYLESSESVFVVKYEQCINRYDG